jgi:WD40 repeat protein
MPNRPFLKSILPQRNRRTRRETAYSSTRTTPRALGTSCQRSASPVVLLGHECWIYAVAISPDNQWLETGSEDKKVPLCPLQVKDLIDVACITVPFREMIC